MTRATDTAPVMIGEGTRAHAPLALGGTTFSPDQWSGQQDANLLAAMATSLENGITHFDTASDYGNGYSERLIGRFLAADKTRRERVFLASKANLNDLSAQAMLAAVDASRERLGVDVIDLYYIHWPRTGKDLRPLMDGLETARQQGKIRAIGVSNFSVEQMAQAGETGRIDAHQLGYNLLWRFTERDIIPYCEAHGIAVVAYASLAHGILTGKFGRETTPYGFPAGDQRRTILLFREDVWQGVYKAVEAMKAAAEPYGLALSKLAARWLLHQRAVSAVVVGAKDAEQAAANTAILSGEIPDSVFDDLTAISDAAIGQIPDEGNPYGYHP